jgi:diamine N-acetyltransferase
MKGKHVRLRALEPDDVELLYEWENDRRIWHLSNTTAPFSRFALEQYVLNTGQDIYASRQLRLMIDLNDPAAGYKTIGSVDLFDFEPVHMRAGVGILIQEDFRKKGYASEALDLLIKYAFEILHFHQVYANIGVDNTDSINLFKKKGFSYTGTKKEWNFCGSEWRDESMFQLIGRSGKTN